jgi:predicted kinase
MAKLIFVKGLPGSGKTTWAKDRVKMSQMTNESAAHWIGRVNKDDIRAKMELDGWTWSREGEKEVIARRDELISSYLSRGQSVISDDTNLAPKHEARLRELARKFKADFEVFDLTTKVTIEECIRRDAGRECPVGEKVIKDMATQFLGYKEPLDIVAPVHDPTLPWVIICDLDGTLALHDGLRGPYEHEKAADDKVNQPVLDVIRAMLHFTEWTTHLVYLSGREDKFREPTLAFLRKNACPDAPLYMRPTGDKRNDTVVKYELFNAHVRGKFNVKFCLDDRDRVVKLWRDMGLPTFQVNFGNF